MLKCTLTILTWKVCCEIINKSYCRLCKYYSNKVHNLYNYIASHSAVEYDGIKWRNKINHGGIKFITMVNFVKQYYNSCHIGLGKFLI